MKNQITGAFRVIAAAFAMTILVGIHSTYAQGTAYSTLATNPDVLAPKSLAVAVFQVENTLKFKVHLENYAGNDVIIKIRNAENAVIYTEKIKNANKYIRKFDLSTIADGEYTFEVSNKKETYTKDINLQTMSARTLQINE